MKSYDRSKWETVKLGDIVEIISGGTPKTDTVAYWDGDIPWCTPTDITSNSNKYIHRTERNITEKGLANSAARLLPKNTLLLCSRATIGAVKIAGQSMCTNQGFKNLVCKEKISHEFLFYYIPKLKAQMLSQASGSTFLEISKAKLANIELEIPCDIEEQNFIANTLAAIDNHINNLESKISKYENIKKSTINLLLAPRSNWQEIKLGDICSITTGKLDANAMSPHGKYAFFTCAKEVYKINNYAFDTEALLVSGNGSHVGYVHYYKGRFNAYQRTYVLDKFTANILFVKYFLDCKLSQRIDAEKKSGNTPYILRDTLYDMKLTIPVSITEQERIATQLSEIDAHIENLKQQLAKQRAIKQGLMQFFFGD